MGRFQANQIQLSGPVPLELYHRYVGDRRFVAGIFRGRTLGGRILKHALQHQHERIYNFDSTTVDGQVSSPCIELTQKFLEFAHYGQGGRIFTYVLTLNGQLRFTETGREFIIDLLSKHSMHSNVSSYIAYSGEFFVSRRHPDPSLSISTSTSSAPVAAAEEKSSETESISANPDDYQLFMDNSSGTYRPSGHCLPALREFISANFPGLHVRTLDCQKDGKLMKQLKDRQVEHKHSRGHPIPLYQQKSTSSSSLSSLSSSDLEASSSNGHNSDDELQRGGEESSSEKKKGETEEASGGHRKEEKNS